MVDVLFARPTASRVLVYNRGICHGPFFDTFLDPKERLYVLVRDVLIGFYKRLVDWCVGVGENDTGSLFSGSGITARKLQKES